MQHNTTTPADLLVIPPDFNFANERMTRATAARYLGTSIEFLEVDAVTKRHGIPYIKVGSKVFYMKADLDAWLMSRRVCASHKR